MIKLEEVQITTATPDDAVIRAMISKKAFDTDINFGSPSLGGPPGYDSPDFHNHVMKVFECYNICYAGQIIGGLVVNAYGKKHCVLEAIYIDPIYHRKGVASVAMEYLFSKYKKAQVWVLGTPEWNTRTKIFYESLGFQQIGWHNCAPVFRCRWYEKIMKGTDRGVYKINSLQEGLKYIIVEGTIKSLGETKVVSSENKKDLVNHALLEDSTSQIPLVLWNEQINEVKVGENFRIEFGSVITEGNKLHLNAGFGVYLIHLM